MLLSLLLLTATRDLAFDNLANSFRNPPASARPHTWWHWMDGNVTKEGITADLEAMKQVGIGGAQMFTVSQEIPKGPVDYNSDRWHAMTQHAIKEAGRLGIELCIHNCAGWSSSGGPWVKPEHAMQVLAWSETKVRGPVSYSEPLPQIKAPQVYAHVNYRKDIAVFAFRTLKDATRFDPNFPGRTGVTRQDGIEPDLTSGAIPIPKAEILTLSDKLDANGRLTWDVPEGDWTILRLGHVPTGKNNHPAPPEGDGLEVDKLSREALKAFWDGMMARVISEAGPLAGKVLNNALVDSYEVGGQNWTPKFREEFKRLRGYDLMPYLLATAGYTVESPAVTARFLWDFRKTISDLFIQNYFAYFGELCHQNGLLFSTEPYGNGGFDNIQAGGTADIPMGEFWIGGGTLETTKLASTVGHLYNKPVIGAEAFTADVNRGKWLEEPYAAKALGDLVFANGINRYIFHRYAHQPWMTFKPGMTMGPWGTHLERTQTWWTEAGTWMKYIARCQSLLQQGKFVADALYFYGESTPVDLPYRPNLKPSMPSGYDYDGCDANTILNRLKVQNGRLVLPDGMSYKVLVLPESKFMTPAVARKITGFIKAGATVVGGRPLHSPSLVGQPQADEDVRNLAAGWTTSATLEQAFAKSGLKPDFEARTASGRAKTAYIHRRIGDAEVYFVSNQQYQRVDMDCTFRVSGKMPELWHPDSGRAERAPIYRSAGGRTVVSLQMGPAESVFVVFRRKDLGEHFTSFESAEMARKVVFPKIAITLARYETDDGRGADVSEIVRRMIRDGEYEIPASNGVFGDPVVNVVKRLRLEYTRDGKPMKASIAENETLSLIQLPRSATDDAFDLHGTTFTPWKAGTYIGKTSSGKAIRIVAAAPMKDDISTNWQVTFDKDWGAPASATFPKLTSWSDHADKGIKYYSGSAVYSRDLNVPAQFVTTGRAVRLDLGVVKNFATVRLNGREVEVLWKEPFSVDLTGKLRAGTNRLEIKVTNLWPNRLIGDEQLPPDVEWKGQVLTGWPEWLVKGEPRPKTGRFTFTTWKYWNKDSELLESGLLGPVVLRSAKRVMLR